MASVQKTKSGFSVHFTDHEKRRRQLRLGNVSKSQANTVATHVGKIVAAKTMNDTPDIQTVQWLAGIGDDLAEKLQTAGLHTRALSISLIDFVDQFILDGRTQDHRPAAVNTVKKWKQARTVLSEFFETRSVRSITTNDAAEFRRWLDTQDRSEAGKRTHIAVIKTFFNAAVNRGLVDSNPFRGQKASIAANPARAFYVSRESALRVIEHCPDNQWRLMFSLWRFAGLRKMEIFNLAWSDILWDKDRMIVRCAKTEHHDGRSVRHVPIGDVRHWLETAFNEATEGTESVITRFSPSNVNLQKPLCTIIERAGLTPWPRLVQNLRASCETDWLTRGLPAHVVARWIGHSVRI